MSNAVLAKAPCSACPPWRAKTFGFRSLDATPFLYPIDPAEDQLRESLLIRNRLLYASLLGRFLRLV